MAPRERKRVPSAFEAFPVPEMSSITALTLTLWFVVNWRRDSPSAVESWSPRTLRPVLQDGWMEEHINSF